VKEIAWWSVYEIGQRLTDKFDDVPEAEIDSRLPRIFIAVMPAIPTARGGQGMNVSMQDAFNLGWKLGQAHPQAVRAEPAAFLSAERQAVAE